MSVLTGKHYRLRMHIAAIQKSENGDAKAILTTIPEAALLEVQGHSQLPNMVEVLWNGKAYIVFSADLELYGNHVWP